MRPSRLLPVLASVTVLALAGCSGGASAAPAEQVHLAEYKAVDEPKTDQDAVASFIKFAYTGKYDKACALIATDSPDQWWAAHVGDLSDAKKCPTVLKENFHELSYSGASQVYFPETLGAITLHGAPDVQGDRETGFGPEVHYKPKKYAQDGHGWYETLPELKWDQSDGQTDAVDEVYPVKTPDGWRVLVPGSYPSRVALTN